MRPGEIALLALLLAAARPARAADEVRFADFATAGEVDAMPALRAAFTAVHRRGAHRLLLPPGRLEIYPDGAFEEYRILSNHDSGAVRIAFLLRDLDDFTVEGQGTELIFHGRMVPFLADHVRGLRLRGFTIDWDQPFNFQGTVAAVDTSLGSFDLRILGGQHTRIRDGQLVQFYNTGDPTTSWEQNLRWSAWFKAVDGPMVPESTPVSHGPYAIELSADHGKPPAQVTRLADGEYRLFHATERLPQPGWILVAKGDLQPERTSPAIYAVDCRNVAVEAVTVRHAGGMGFMAERCENVSLDHFEVRRAPGSPRVVTTTADATHFLHCRGQIVIRRCWFENMLDDGTNIHGAYLLVARRLDAHSLLVRFGHYQQFGSRFADPGDLLRFAPRRTLLPFFKAKLAGLEKLNGLEQVLHFDAALPDSVGSGCVVDNASCQPDVLIEQTTVRNNRARSLMIKTEGRVVIDSCRLLDPSLSAVMSIVDADNYYESGPLGHLEIRHCTIETDNADSPVFLFHPMRTDLTASSGFFDRHLVIEDNTIRSASGAVLEAWLAQDIRFARNRITAPPSARHTAKAFAFRGCDKVEIMDNRALSSGVLGISADAKTTNIEAAGNSGIGSPP